VRNNRVTATLEQSNLPVPNTAIAAACRPKRSHVNMNMKETSMTTKNIVIALAFTVVGATLALAQGSTPQATNSANVHATNLDRCPYYPSPVFCRSDSQSRGQDEIGHNADGR
jgi:hypothetical protein